jgi:hypothetical protein
VAIEHGCAGEAYICVSALTGEATLERCLPLTSRLRCAVLRRQCTLLLQKDRTVLTADSARAGKCGYVGHVERACVTIIDRDSSPTAGPAGI